MKEVINLESNEEKGLSKVKSNIFCLNIIGEVEGHSVLPSQNKSTKYEHIIPKLVEIEEDKKTEGLLVILNTVGGDVEAGLAIAELIAGMSKPKVSLILGGGHSIGVPLAVAADYSFIAPSATMTIHPIRTNGTIIGSNQAFEYLNKLQQSIISFVINHSSISKERFTSLMNDPTQIANDIGTILFGKETVECGLIDESGTIKDALDKLHSMIKEKK